MTTKWIQCITAIGLSQMPADARRERMNRVFTKNTEISGKALAELIDECKAVAGAILEKDGQAISDAQRYAICKMLALTDGKREVADIEVTSNIDWLLELRESALVN